MNNLLTQIKWQFLIFQRNNLIPMIGGITIFYILLVFLIRDIPGVERFITLLIYNDPAVLGFVFVGVSIILENDQNLLHPLFASPLNPHVYLISRITTLSIIGVIAAIAIVFTAKGGSFNWLHFSAGAFWTCFFFGLIAVFVVSYTMEILHFLLRGTALLLLMSLPLLNYFELTDISFLKLFPVQGGLYLMTNSYRDVPNSLEILYGYILIGIWSPVIYAGVYRIFRNQMVRK